MGWKISERTVRFLLCNEGSDDDIESIKKTLEPFNLFAFVLHIPSVHLDFDRKLNEKLDSLDLVGADRFLFFALVEPDNRRANRFETRPYYRALQSWENKIFPNGSISCEIEPIVREITRSLKIPFDSLPAIVVSNNILAQKKRCYKTSAETIDEQFFRLGLIARDYPGIKTNWGYAGHVLEKYKEEIDLCNSSGSKRLTKEDLSSVLKELFGNAAPTKNINEELQDKKIDFKSLHLLPPEKQYAFLKEDNIYRIIFAGKNVGSFSGSGFAYLYQLVFDKGKIIAHRSLFDRIRRNPHFSKNPKDPELIGNTNYSQDEKSKAFDNIIYKEKKFQSQDPEKFEMIDDCIEDKKEERRKAEDRGDFDSAKKIEREIERINGFFEKYKSEIKEDEKAKDKSIDAVGNAIKRALKKIKNKEVVKHFKGSIGQIYSPYGLRYHPHVDIEWITE